MQILQSKKIGKQTKGRIHWLELDPVSFMCVALVVSTAAQLPEGPAGAHSLRLDWVQQYRRHCWWVFYSAKEPCWIKPGFSRGVNRKALFCVVFKRESHVVWWERWYQIMLIGGIAISRMWEIGQAEMWRNAVWSLKSDLLFWRRKKWSNELSCCLMNNLNQPWWVLVVWCSYLSMGGL